VKANWRPASANFSPCSVFASPRSLQAGVVDLGLVGLDDATILADQRFLGIDLLLGDGVLAEQVVVPLQIDRGGGEQGFVLGQLAMAATLARATCSFL
jgi:hypothetical protein